MSAPPLGAEVRISPDAGASALWGIACATPCGGRGRCAGNGGHPGMGPLRHGRGVCWLGSGRTREEAEARAARLGWRVVA